MSAARRTQRSRSTTDAAPAREPFDRDYYRRFYENARTRVISEREVGRLADFVCTYARYLEQPIRRVVDLGCGLGWWRAAIERHYPKARYTGVEVSTYLCETHGWKQGSVVDFSARTPFDLVVCQGVLQYLDNRTAAAAIDNLAQLTRGLLYLEALTTEDWQENCDRDVTDGSVHLRTGRWYRKHLAPHFVSAGGGVFVSRRSDVVLFELERA